MRRICSATIWLEREKMYFSPALSITEAAFFERDFVFAVTMSLPFDFARSFGRQHINFRHERERERLFACWCRIHARHPTIYSEFLLISRRSRKKAREKSISSNLLKRLFRSLFQSFALRYYGSFAFSRKRKWNTIRINKYEHKHFWDKRFIRFNRSRFDLLPPEAVQQAQPSHCCCRAAGAGRSAHKYWKLMIEL